MNQDLSMVLVELTDSEMALVTRVLEEAKLSPIVPSEKDVDIDDLLFIFNDAWDTTKTLRECTTKDQL